MENIAEAIRKAVTQLDPANDDHWTKAEGLPEVKPIRELTGDASISRADVEAAVPGYNREAAKNAASEPPETETPTAETKPEPEETAPVAATPPAPASEEEPAKAAEETEPADTETDPEPEPEEERGDMMMRVLVMAIIIKLGPSLRMVSDSQKLDEMMEFLLRWPEHQRQGVYEMLRSLAESLPDQIASGAYKSEIARAMAVVTTCEYVPPPIVGGDPEQQEAALRLTMEAVSNMSRPVDAGGDPVLADPSDDSEATPEQIAAKQMLYGNTDGVREPDA